MARLFSERAFVGNFLEKLEGGNERLLLYDAENIGVDPAEVLDEYIWMKGQSYSKVHRMETPRQFYRAIDDAVSELQIPQADIILAQEEFRKGNLRKVRGIVFPVIRYLHKIKGYNIVDLSGEHMMPRRETATA